MTDRQQGWTAAIVFLVTALGALGVMGWDERGRALALAFTVTVVLAIIIVCVEDFSERKR